ncbi:hypothetical protein QVD17_30444 [Tagetes erecta]|uniref:Uncharacterized protein n=1 Tax=Tagetes erecta TaxID=13708 RepID=A0AAD8NM83_TARER|nr:hypothetical protein QVD17_30444 [Tagetes erecta]
MDSTGSNSGSIGSISASNRDHGLNSEPPIYSSGSVGEDMGGEDNIRKENILAQMNSPVTIDITTRLVIVSISLPVQAFLSKAMASGAVGSHGGDGGGEDPNDHSRRVLTSCQSSKIKKTRSKGRNLNLLEKHAANDHQPPNSV